MSAASGVNAVLALAKEKEGIFDWLGAAECYEKGISSIPETEFSDLGRLEESLGHAFFKAAMQADCPNEFSERMRRAESSYEKARDAYFKTSGRANHPKVTRCDAMTAYIHHWLATKAPEKKKLLYECWELSKQSLKGFEQAGDSEEYVKTYNQLSTSALFIFTRESDFESRKKAMSEGMERGETAIRLLSESGDTMNLARALVRTVLFLGVYGYYCQDIGDRDQYLEKGLDYWARARQLSDEVALTEFIFPVFGGQPVFGVEATDEAFANFRKALEYGKAMKDNFVIGCALDWLTYHTVWKVYGTEDPDEKKRLIGVSSKLADESKSFFSKICFVSPRGDMAWVEVYGVTSELLLAEVETDLKNKRSIMERISEIATNLQRIVEESGYPELMIWFCSGWGSVSEERAKFESNPEKKKGLLEFALEKFRKSSSFTDRLAPFAYWNRGTQKAELGGIKREIADVTKEPLQKEKLLQEAVSNKKEAIEFCLKELKFMERKGSRTALFASVGNMQYNYGNMIIHLFDVNKDEQLLAKAQQAYQEATEYYQKLDLASRVSECWWRKAQVCDMLGDFSKAAQAFDCAANNYRSALEKTPQLKKFYGDHASYMEAWNEIEKAKQHHAKQEYSLAEEHFLKASELHQPLKQWSFFAPNYEAWAQLDHAEVLSRAENSETSLEAFELAAKRFEDTKKSLLKGLETIEDSDEKQIVTRILKATDLRRQYCTARIEVEEAKILDKKGDHSSSSEKYDSAADKFARISEAVDSQRDKKEFNLIATLSKAWGKMTLAEAEESPDLYEEASILFEKAKELSPNEKTKTLTLGHSRFCKALEAGVRFGDTGDIALHDLAVQQLENAGQHYLKAGFQEASEYAEATELLLDAYLHINNAKKETDPEKRAKLFAVAEKVLQTSAGCFMKAEHPEKREQVLRLFEKVKRERELSTSLNEVLHTPSVVSTTAAFATPTPSQENAVGVERFENANVQANIVSRQRQLKVGEDWEVEIELVNAGKGPALLMKVSDVVPSGFELREKPEAYRLEDSYMNLKGKRIDPLKTEELKLTLKPTVQGEFSFKPTVMYLDENGRYRSHQPEAMNIVVKELGIKGWIKGER